MGDRMDSADWPNGVVVIGPDGQLHTAHGQPFGSPQAALAWASERWPDRTTHILMALDAEFVRLEGGELDLGIIRGDDP
jgi:hypothetical protein